MRFRSIRYYIKEAFNGIFRNSFMSIAAFITVSACILLLTLSFIIAQNLDYFLVQVRTVGVSVFLDDDLTDSELLALKKRIEELPLVKSVEYVSKSDAKDIFFSDRENDETKYKDIFEEVFTENPLPRSFNLVIDSQAYSKGLLDELNAIKSSGAGIENIKDGKTLMDTLITINNIIRIIIIIIFLLFSLLSVIIIINTIKLTVHNRKNEITVMKYVGATDWFIRWPFVIEGIIIGMIGAFIPVIICWLLYPNFSTLMQNSFPTVMKSMEMATDAMIFPFLFSSALILGALLGCIGSFLSVIKYLKV